MDEASSKPVASLKTSPSLSPRTVHPDEEAVLYYRIHSEEDVNKSMTVLVRTSCVERVSFGREPAQLVCKKCGQFITTEISRHNGVCAFFTVLVALFLCTPCAWVPLVIPTFKDTLHSCPNCGNSIGVHRYFK